MHTKGILIKQRRGLRSYFNFVHSLCRPLDGSNKDDVSNLFENVAELFEDVVQYNEDNREFEGVKGTNITIATICNIMNDDSLGTAMQRQVL